MFCDLTRPQVTQGSLRTEGYHLGHPEGDRTAPETGDCFQHKRRKSAVSRQAWKLELSSEGGRLPTTRGIAWLFVTCDGQLAVL